MNTHEVDASDELGWLEDPHAKDVERCYTIVAIKPARVQNGYGPDAAGE